MPEQASTKAVLPRLRTGWEARHRRRPAALYHYTTGQGLLGLLQGARLWATNARFLNDPSEIQYGTQLVQEELEAAGKRREAEAKKGDGVPKGFLFGRLMEKLYTASYTVPRIEKWSKEALGVFETQGEPYITCFCKDGDLLSEWRGYGSAGCGYAVGFDSGRLAGLALDGTSRNVLLRRVIYNEREQRKIVRSWVNAIYGREEVIRQEISERFQQLRSRKTTLADLLKSGQSGEEKEFRERVGSHVAELKDGMDNFTQFLAECLVCFKNPSYREEAEWRLITFVKMEGADAPRIEFRARQDAVIPYVKLSSPEDRTKLPISHVICGPTSEVGPTSKAVALLGQKSGYAKFPVKRSVIPYRG